MNKELQDLHLKAMLFDLGAEKKETSIESDSACVLVISPRWNRTETMVLPAYAVLWTRFDGDRSLTGDRNQDYVPIDSPARIEKIRQVYLDGLAVRDNFNLKYADVIALSADDITRLKGVSS